MTTDTVIDDDLLAFAGGATTATDSVLLAGVSKEAGSRKKKNTKSTATAAAATKKQHVHFAADSMAASADEGSPEPLLALEDLTAVLAEDTGFADLKRRVASLTGVDDSTTSGSKKKRKSSASTTTTSTTTTSTAPATVLAAPLPEHQQARLERATAFELAKADADRWIPIIKANRRAPQLVYPPREPTTAVHILDDLDNEDSGKCDGESSKSNPNTTNANTTKNNTLQERMQALLRAADMDSESGVLRQEQLAMAKMSAEEVERRFAELAAKRRALLFYGEQRARRQAKIKSKTYRKHLKRERERAIANSAAGESLTAEEWREEQMKAQMARIRERMTLKTQRANKWAHQLLGKRKGMESGSREEVMQQVRDKQRLREEIMGKARDYDDDDCDDDCGDEEEYSDDEYSDEDSSEEESSEGRLKDVLRAARSLGDEDEEEEDKVVVVAGEGETKRERKGKRKSDHRDDYVIDENEEENVDDDDDGGEIENIFSLTSAAEKRAKKTMSSSTLSRRKYTPSNPLNQGASSAADAEANDYDDDNNNSNNDNNNNLFQVEEVEEVEGHAHFEQTTGKNTTTTTKADRHKLAIIREAFAADDVFGKFAAQKEATIDAEAAEANGQDNKVLPGWGSWSGAGLPTNNYSTEHKDSRRRTKKQQQQQQQQQRNRRDAHLAHVIINEKQVSKKALNYMVGKLPYPYQTVEEYEAAIRKPLGKEWNSATTFVKHIKPRVQVKVGSIIEPIKFHSKKQKEQRSQL